MTCLGAGVRIATHCVIKDAVIETAWRSRPSPTSTAPIGAGEDRPLARLREGTELGLDQDRQLHRDEKTSSVKTARPASPCHSATPPAPTATSAPVRSPATMTASPHPTTSATVPSLARTDAGGPDRTRHGRCAGSTSPRKPGQPSPSGPSNATSRAGAPKARESDDD